MTCTRRTSWPAKACAHMKNESSYRGSGGMFDLAMLSLVGLGALGGRNELAIALWVTIVCVAALRLRSRRGPQLPCASLVANRTCSSRRLT